jgi:hypothetical protein
MTFPGDDKVLAQLVGLHYRIWASVAAGALRDWDHREDYADHPKEH